jgi:hypothetical protein
MSYCYDHVTIDGLIFPTLRRVVRRTPEEREAITDKPGRIAQEAFNAFP